MSKNTSFRRVIAKMGYYSYQGGLIYNHVDQDGGWDEHLYRCRRYILNILGKYKPNRVTVIGSGWLLELPIAEMVESIPEICLIDIVHPPEVYKQLSRYKNVELSEADATGGLINVVWEKTKGLSFFNRRTSLNDIVIPEFIPGEDPGMVISLNILTQLEWLLVKQLRKKSKILEEEFYSFRKKIQEKHIDFLKKHKSVLISDVEEVFTEKSGNTFSHKTVLTNLPDSDYIEEWIWDFDRNGAGSNGPVCNMKVKAMIF
jgi:hypothetical protein